MGGALVSLISSFLMLIVSMLEYKFIYNISFKGNILQYILLFLVMIPGVYGFGSIFASLVLWAKETSAAVQLIRGIIMIFCGISFPAAFMPLWMQSISKALPFTFGISAARSIMIQGAGILGAITDLLWCFVIGLLFLLLGRLCFVLVEKKVRNSGSLERF